MERRKFSSIFRMMAAGCGLALLAGGCSQPNVELRREGWGRADVPLALVNVDPALPPIAGKEYPQFRAGNPEEPLKVGPGSKVMLVYCEAEGVPGARGDEWRRAHVIVLDSLSTGTFEVTPANGRLIETSEFHPARRPYIGLEGKIQIVKISGDSVVANCQIRNIIRLADEPVHPLRGLYEFRLGSGEEPALERCAIRVSGLGAPAAPPADKK